MGKLEGYLNRRFSELEWGIGISLKCDNDESPSDILMDIRGAPQKMKFAAQIASQYLVKNSLCKAPLEICSLVYLNDCIKVELSRSNKTEAMRSLITFFGGMDEVIKTIKSRPAFWKSVIRGHLLSNYGMVTIHRNYFEELLDGDVPVGDIVIETLSKKPLREIPLKELLPLIKEVYETSLVTDRVEIDGETIIFFHNYRNNEVTEKLKKSLLELLKAGGHLYDAKSTSNMIVLSHRQDAGIKINAIVDELKTSHNKVDQELIILMAVLKGLRDIPETPLSLTVMGRRIGRSIIQEYEEENGIVNWNPETFRKAFEAIDSRLHRVSEWKTDGKNLHYTIRKCSIAMEGNTFDKCVCHAVRETFKGALGYAFGNKAELEIVRLLSHNDKFCEVVIRTA
ncbi:Uncharacterised protein [uncultured archaeon]|nr:Uncharacterised protein [uncultured archaeon]